MFRTLLILWGLLLIAAGIYSEQKAHYRNHDGVLLNDLIVTPGKVRTYSRTDVCTETTKKYRNTTEAMKKQVCDLYGVKDCPKEGAIEIDHLISLELGGADDVSNLWPQPAEPKPGFHEKDKLENYLHKQVCTGKLSLSLAQAKIANNWYAAYLEMQTKEKEAERAAYLAAAR